MRVGRCYHTVERQLSSSGCLSVGNFAKRIRICGFSTFQHEPGQQPTTTSGRRAQYIEAGLSTFAVISEAQRVLDPGCGMDSRAQQDINIPEADKKPIHRTEYEGQEDDLHRSFESLTASAKTEETHNSILAPAHSEEHISKFGISSLLKKGLAKVTEDAAYYHYGNYVINRKTGEKCFEQMPIYVRIGMHLLYCGSIEEAMVSGSRAQKLFLKQSIEMGKTFDDPKSKQKIPGFIKDFRLDLSDLAIQDIDKYQNFNDFFSRGLKPGARPAAEPQDEKRLVCAADCRLVVFDSIDLAREYWVKGKKFTVTALLYDDEHAGAFFAGALAIFRLAPQDYHRWHTPISGKVVRFVDAGKFLMSVNPMIVNENLDVFTENKRSIAFVQTPHSKIPVAVVAVGAMLVGSIEWTVKEGQEIVKGQEMGLFKYGGSTVITIFPADFDVRFDEDLVGNSKNKCETQVSVGESLGKILAPDVVI